jgi:hypothetical protein
MPHKYLFASQMKDAEYAEYTDERRQKLAFFRVHPCIQRIPRPFFAAAIFSGFFIPYAPGGAKGTE